MTLFGLAAEDVALKEIIQRLVDRVLCDRVDWLDDSLVPNIRSWCGHRADEAYLPVPSATKASSSKLSSRLPVAVLVWSQLVTAMVTGCHQGRPGQMSGGRSCKPHQGWPSIGQV